MEEWLQTNLRTETIEGERESGFRNRFKKLDNHFIINYRLPLKYKERFIILKHTHKTSAKRKYSLTDSLVNRNPINRY